MDGIDIAANHIWLEGLTVRNQSYATFSIAAPEDVVIKGCGFYNNHYSIYLQQGGSNWYIADNTIVGDTPASSESFSGEGIELNITSGHTVAHNSITNVSDGISYPLTNVDIFGNDIFDTSDDGIEADNGKSNVRMWGNRIHNAVHNAISFQPQAGAPWYIIRNQIVSNKEAPFKFRTTDRFVLLHNTLVNWGSISCCNDHHLFGAYARNNLWISNAGGQIWYFGTNTKDWRTDMDYDGFDWGEATSPFVYGGKSYPDIFSLATGSGLERNGRRVSKSTVFANFAELSFNSPSPGSVSPIILSLSNHNGSFINPAIGTGVVLPNVNDKFVVDGQPDLGANEYGQSAPSYGPRVGPPAPTATFTASPSTINSGDSVTLSWSTTDATTVNIDQGVGAVGTSGSTVITPTAPTTYTLTAGGAGGTATKSVTVNVTYGYAPAAPDSLTAMAVSGTQIDLKWADKSGDEDGFTIERSTLQDFSGQISTVTVGANTTSYLDPQLSASTTYYYRVRAFSSAGNSGYSNTAVVTTTATAPAAPTNLTATAASSSQINLLWADNSNNETGFKVERCQSSNCSNFTQVATVGAGVTSYQNTGLLASTTYSYRVRAYNGGGDSGYSNAAVVATTATAPAAPTNLTATVMSSSQVNLKWNDNSANEEKFIIERSAYDTFSVMVSFEVSKDVTTFQNTGLTKSTKYFYRVRAHNSVGTSAPSNSASVRTKSR